MSYQTGWIQERERKDWTAFKVYWREKAGSGEWVIKSKTLPREINGKATVKKDAQQALDRILQTVNARDGAAVVTSGLTFDLLLDTHWADYVEKEKLRDSTLDGYTAMINQWIKPYFGGLFMKSITKETVSAFFKHLRTEGLSDQYQKNMYGLLSKLFELAVAFDMMPVSPVIKMLHRPHVERGEKTTLPVEKVRALFEKLPATYRAPFALLLLTGMRQGELLGLRWQDVDFGSKLIWKRNVVYCGQLKEGLKQTRRTGRAKKHVIGISPLIENIITLHKESSKFTRPEDYVFCREDGRPLDPDHVRRYVLYPAMEAAEIPVVARESGLHMFRHTVVSVVARRLGLKSAQDQAGHADINTTANVYTHVDEEQKIETASALSEVFATHLLPSMTGSGVTN